MISEGPCDTEDWSNDAENTDFIFEYPWDNIKVLILFITVTFFLLLQFLTFV